MSEQTLFLSFVLMWAMGFLFMILLKMKIRKSAAWKPTIAFLLEAIPSSIAGSFFGILVLVSVGLVGYRIITGQTTENVDVRQTAIILVLAGVMIGSTIGGAMANEE